MLTVTSCVPENYGYSNEKPDNRYKSINTSKCTVHQYLAQAPDTQHVMFVCMTMSRSKIIHNLFYNC